MANRTIGLKSIAYELGISVNSVSRALRDCDDISEATKEKVRQKAFEMGYLPNNISQFIRRDGRYLIAVVINSMTNLYFSVVERKIVNNIMASGYDFTLVYTTAKKMETDVVKQCISERVDAIITLIEPSDEAIEACKFQDIPIAMVGRNINKDYVDEIYTNDEDGGMLVAKYLCNFHKMDKFVYVKLASAECSKRRQKGFVDTLKKEKPNAEILTLEFKQAMNSLYDLIKQDYNGIFCFNDEMAYEILSDLNERVASFRKVFPHMHIIGYDCLNTRIKGLVDLTSIDFDYDKICELACECIKARLKKKDTPPQKICLPVALHTRRNI